MTSQWRHRSKTHTWYSELNFLQNVYFGFFILGKLTEWHHFVTYLWNDPRTIHTLYCIHYVLFLNRLNSSIHSASSTVTDKQRSQTWESDKTVFTNNDFLDEVTSTQFYCLWHVKCRNNLTTYRKTNATTASTATAILRLPVTLTWTSQ